MSTLPGEVPRPILRAAHGCLVLAALFFASHVGHALWIRRSHGMAAGAAALALASLLTLRAAPRRRAMGGLTLGSALLGLHGFEIVAGVQKPRAATAAALAGRRWDGRLMLDVMEDLRAEGRDAWPSVRPRLLYNWRHSGLRIEGQAAFPLGGISGVTTILCNEGGAWSTYEADEHGFNNPRGLWSQPVELGLVGDSFTQGACVPAGRDIAAPIRRRHPATLNLGMLGNGPLLELAAVAEMLTPVKPRRVLWLYFRNDLADLAVESASPLLRRYLDGFRLGLPEHQAEVDLALRRAGEALEAEAERWPATLDTLGIHRRGAPTWLQDLALRKDNSSVSSVIRLDSVFRVLGGGEAPPSAAVLELFGRVLGRAKQTVEGWGGQMIFVYLPDLWPVGAARMLDHPSRAAVLAAARDAGLDVIDVHAALQPRDLRALVYFPGSHCNEPGYEAYGQAIVDALDR